MPGEPRGQHADVEGLTAEDDEAERQIAGRLRSARTSWENAEGVWLSTVTRSSASSSWNSSVSRVVQYGTTTSRPPLSRQPQISHTEKSKALEWKRVQVSWGPSSKSSAVASTRATTLAWGTTTPFGRPVEPDV